MTTPNLFLNRAVRRLGIFGLSLAIAFCAVVLATNAQAADESSAIRLNTVGYLPKAEKTGYLDTKRPIKYSFTLDNKIKKGKHTLKGTVRYFFCSDTEGWCNRSSQPIQLTFTVTQ